MSLVAAVLARARLLYAADLNVLMLDLERHWARRPSPTGMRLPVSVPESLDLAISEHPALWRAYFDVAVTKLGARFDEERQILEVATTGEQWCRRCGLELRLCGCVFREDVYPLAKPVREYARTQPPKETSE